MGACGLSYAQVSQRFAAPEPAQAGARPGSEGLPLLHAAVTSGQAAMVAAVLAWGARYGQPADWAERAPAAGGLTPLHLAVVMPNRWEGGKG
jgi:hypothetical protein